MPPHMTSIPLHMTCMPPHMTFIQPHMTCIPPHMTFIDFSQNCHSMVQTNYITYQISTKKIQFFQFLANWGILILLNVPLVQNLFSFRGYEINSLPNKWCAASIQGVATKGPIFQRPNFQKVQFSKTEFSKVAIFKRCNLQKVEFSKGRIFKRPNFQKVQFSKG